MTSFNALSHKAITSGLGADCFTVQCGLMINLVYMCRQYGKDYIAVEDAAHQAHKGMWQGSFEMPADWRKDQKIDKLLAQRGRSLQPQGEFLVTAECCLPQHLPCAIMVLTRNQTAFCCHVHML